MRSQNACSDGPSVRRRMLRADDPFAHLNDNELQIAVGRQPMDVVADGVTGSSASKADRRLTVDYLSSGP